VPGNPDATDVVMVPMRDGTRLYTEVSLPADSAEGGPYPVVLTRGYWPGSAADARRFNDAGYAYVGQSTRGHGSSEGAEGTARRFFDDAEDGYDALSWIAAQPWSDGRVAMYGKSYWGITQWLVSPLRHPNLAAIIPQVTHPRSWIRGYWCHGALSLAMTATGRAYDPSSPDEMNRIAEMGWRDYFMHLPLVTLDEVLGRTDRLWKDYVTHSVYDDYWRAIDVRDRKLARVSVPVYQMGGWFDHYPGPALDTLQKLDRLASVPDNRIVINPSDHLNRVWSDRDFGPDATKDEIALAVRWLDCVVRGRETGVRGEGRLRLFKMGANAWREANEWPPAETRFTRFYLRGDGSRTGTLAAEPPGDDPPTSYTYDPADPVPARGGNHSFLSTEIPEVLRSGSVDQRPIESRDDVLVYTTEPLARDLEVTGPVEAVIYASSSAPDTDFIVRLIDVGPDGAAWNLTEGILRARFREDIWGEPRLMEPGDVYEFRIDMMATSNVFLRGHSIRVHVASASFPQWDRNPNTGAEQGMDAETRPARQKIYHDRLRPSHVILPVIPTG
jgi:putative CocE/NonD family hydrolase